MVATLTKSKTVSAANEQFKYHFHIAFSPKLKTHNLKSPWSKKPKNQNQKKKKTGSTRSFKIKMEPFQSNILMCWIPCWRKRFPSSRVLYFSILFHV